ncbi:facilitated trehalose transporter Tret1-like [Macrobrachium nipponense]|uniref:facilitated trehalose transporter Tret1-like n=1 Tax=Macrobrachium nipponense TaxID=159736 RepID=UPI0030C7C116
MVQLKIPPTFKQIFAAASSGLVLSGLMTVLGLSHKALASFEQPGDQLYLTPEECSWFANIPILMGIPGTFLGGFLAERFGPRRIQMVMIPLLFTTFVLMHTTSWKSVQELVSAKGLLITARVLQSTIASLPNPATCQYPCEIGDSRLRGFLTSLTDAWSSFGFLLCYFLGVFFHWSTLMLLLPTVTLLPALMGLLASHESPLWLARNGQMDKALHSLTAMRSSREDAPKELKQIEGCLQGSSQNSSMSHSLRVLKKKKNIIPLIMGAAIIFLKELTGNTYLMVFMVEIFKKTGVPSLTKWGSVIVSFTRVVCGVTGSILLSRFPRKKLLIYGITLAGAANVTLCAYFFLRDQGHGIADGPLLPSAALLIYMLGYAPGIGPSSWLISTEILPSEVRSLGCAINTSMCALTAFILSYTFTYFQNEIETYIQYGVSSIGCLVFGLLVICVLPETKDKTLQEIELLWTGKSKFPSWSFLKKNQKDIRKLNSV